VETLNLPDDLRAFLETGRPLVYDVSRAVPKGITLLPIDRLAVRTLGARIPPDSSLADEDPHAGEVGTYRVPAVDLVGTCRNYSPLGQLVWLPDPAAFGTHDGDHGVLWAFPGVRWSDIAARPVQYLNARWEPGQADARQLRLWELFPWEPRNRPGRSRCS
jgi:hypothetical protein